MVTCSMAMSTREAIQMDMEKFNNDAMCWGVENMMYYRLAQYQAMEECSKSGLASRMVRPTNPFTTLPANLNNQQGPLNRFLNNANSRNPLSALLSRNDFPFCPSFVTRKFPYSPAHQNVCYNCRTLQLYLVICKLLSGTQDVHH